MDINEIVYRMQLLSLPADKFVICGGAPLTALGLREAADIDLFVTPDLFDFMQENGWQLLRKPNSSHVGLVYDLFEAHKQWTFCDYVAKFQTVRSKADSIHGLPFMNLQETKLWKSALGRPKDIQDIALIDSYLSTC
jgi:hypothetical protein